MLSRMTALLADHGNSWDLASFSRRVRWLVGCAALVCLGATGLHAQAPAQKFSETLTAEQRAAIGLGKLSPEEVAALDAAADAFRRSVEAVATKQAVAEYKKHEEPGIVARALASFKRQEAEARQENINAHIVGRFTGWEGHTVFRLDNGQTWRQVGSGMYYVSPVQNPEVEIYRTSSGIFRLRVSDGPSIAVMRAN